MFPNSRLPVLIYRGVLETPDAAVFEQMFEANGWSSAWRNGLYSVHHYHSTAHEVLGIYGGRVTARLGGGRGTSVTLVAGDVVVIPAGVAHKNDGASADFRVVGAYPVGTSPDMQYGKAGRAPRHRPQHRARRHPRRRSRARRRPHRRAVEGEVTARVQAAKSLGSPSA